MTRESVSLLVLVACLVAVAQAAPQVLQQDADDTGVTWGTVKPNPLAPAIGKPLRSYHHKVRRSSRPALSSEDDDDSQWRLGTDVIPLHYTLTIQPWLPDKFTFHGSVTILVNVLKTTNIITLNALDLHVFDDSVFVYSTLDDNNEYTSSESVTFDEVHEMITVNFTNSLEAGSRYKIWFRGYDGSLNDLETGFYRSHYKVNNETKWLAVTQFEETGARMAFPCFDEPSFKARFDITIIHDSSLFAVSNMPLLSTSTTANPGYVTETFETTPPMSTYLVAFLVSAFGAISDSDTIFKTYARKTILSGAVFAEQVGPQALNLEAEWTGIPYALPKEDEAAIPDFAAGAMENWGLVTYREPYLIETETSTTVLIESIATVICHELGHQWTGDLVTLDWWSHTWLNEAFATYFEHYICAKIKPEWNLLDKYLPEIVHFGMEADALDTQHAMNYPVSTPTEADAIFDDISYDKGGAVLRMFDNVLTTDVFRAGVHRYLLINAYSNGNPSLLYEAIDYFAQNASVLPSEATFADFASSWTDQPGLPVLFVNRTVGVTQVISFSQQRFFYTAPYSDLLLDQSWWIPLAYVTKKNPTLATTSPSAWLSPDIASLSLSIDVEESEWLIVNPSTIYYYRVNYDDSNWALIAAALNNKSSTFPTATRIQLLSDSLALARANMINYSIALAITDYLTSETEVAPWITAVTSFSFLRDRLVGTDTYDEFLQYLQKLTTNAFQLVGFNLKSSETKEERLLRYYVTPCACMAGVKDCLDSAAALLSSWLASPSTTTVHPDIRSPTLCYGVRAGNATTFQKMKSMWLKETDSDTRFEYLSALACSSSETLLTGLMNDGVNGKLSINSSEVRDVFVAISNELENHNLVLSYVQKNLTAIDKFFGNSSVSTGLLQTLISGIRTRTDFYNTRVWIESAYTNTSSAYLSLQASLLVVNTDLAWFDDLYESLASAVYDDLNPSSGNGSGAADMRGSIAGVISLAALGVALTLTGRLAS